MNTATDLLLDPGDARLARAATGLLGVFNTACVLDAADVHVATGRCGWARCASTSPG